MLNVYRRRIVRTLRRRGLLGTARMALGIGLLYLKVALSPAFRAARRAECRSRAAREAEFDRAHGVETAETVLLDTLDVVGLHRNEGFSYEAVDPDLFREQIAALRIDFPQYTFIDLGCGKGRTLLIAAQFPFRQVRGVEFAPACTPSPRRTSPSAAGRAAAVTYERTWPTRRSIRSPTGRWSSSCSTRSTGP